MSGGRSVSTFGRSIAAAAFVALVGEPSFAQDTETSIEQVDPATGASISASYEFDLYTDTSEAPVYVGDPFGLLPEPRSGAAASVINQIGEDNIASAQILGARNRTAQVQDGFGNVSTVTVAGDYNDVVTSQLGADNATAVSVQADNTSTATIQLGAGLSISVDRTGPGGPPITLVQQNGN